MDKTQYIFEVLADQFLQKFIRGRDKKMYLKGLLPPTVITLQPINGDYIRW